MEDMKQIHDFAAKRSDKLRDQNTNCTVVPFPEFAALKAEVEKLRVEISMLLLERDELRFVICKNEPFYLVGKRLISVTYSFDGVYSTMDMNDERRMSTRAAFVFKSGCKGKNFKA